MEDERTDRRQEFTSVRMSAEARPRNILVTHSDYPNFRGAFPGTVPHKTRGQVRDTVGSTCSVIIHELGTWEKMSLAWKKLKIYELGQPKNRSVSCRPVLTSILRFEVSNLVCRIARASFKN